MNSKKLLSHRKQARKQVSTVPSGLPLKQQRRGLSCSRRKVNIFNTSIDNLSTDELLGQLDRGVVFTPNVDHIMKLREDPQFVAAYQRADFKVCDSQIVMYAAKFLGTPLKAKISGSDLLPLFCDYHRHNENIKIFVLGGAAGVPQKAMARINARIGREIVVSAHSPSFGFEKDSVENSHVLTMVRQSEANVLVVGLGSPKQEKWIAEYCDHLPNIDIFMGVGAAIDFEAGTKRRAPQWVSQLGLEWLWRLVLEPRRLWKRYILDDLPFLWLVLQQKLAK